MSLVFHTALTEFTLANHYIHFQMLRFICGLGESILCLLHSPLNILFSEAACLAQSREYK